MDPLTTPSTRPQARAVRPRTQTEDDGATTVPRSKLSDLPPDIIRHVLAQSDVAAHVSILQQFVLENRAPNGPWSAAARDTLSDVALLKAHPAIAAALDKLVLDVPIMSLAQASIPSAKSDPFSQRRQAFTARCLWGNLAAPGERTVERLAILNVITPSRERQRETLDLLNVKLHSAETAGLTDDGRCALLERLRKANFPPELADGHMRATPILMQLIHGLAPERKIPQLRKLVSHATRHNLDDVFHAIVECVPELLAHPGSSDHTVAFCKELFLVPAHNEIDYLRWRKTRDELTVRPHIKQLSDVLHAHGNLPSHLQVILAAADGDLHYAYNKCDYEHANTIELLNAPLTTLAAKADFCEIVARNNNLEQLSRLLKWLIAEVRYTEIPTDAKEQNDYARRLALALSCAHNEWLYQVPDPDEPELLHLEPQFDRSIRLKLLADAKALVSHAQLSPKIELSLIKEFWKSPIGIDPYSASNDFTKALRRCAPTAAGRIQDADFFHTQADLRFMKVFLHSFGRDEISMTPVERVHFEKQLSSVFNSLANPKFLETICSLICGDEELIGLVKTYISVAENRLPPLPLHFAEEFAKLALRRSSVPIPAGESLPETIERLYDETHGQESEARGFYGDCYLHGVHAYRNALQTTRPINDSPKEKLS